MQDMLLDKTSYEDKSPQDRALAKDVILDATKFGQSFEQLLGRLSAFDTPESNNALTAGIEKMDILNNSLNLHKEVCRVFFKKLMSLHIFQTFFRLLWVDLPGKDMLAP